MLLLFFMVAENDKSYAPTLGIRMEMVPLF